MFRVKIIQDNSITNTLDFDTETEADAYIVDVDSSKHWGNDVTFEKQDVTEEYRKKEVLSQITELENKITQRRLREAILSGDYSFIDSINSQISNLRSQLS